MRRTIIYFSICVFLVLQAVSAIASEEKFDSQKMLSDIEEQLQLSKDKLDELKPAFDKKSAELKGTIDEAVEQGFVQLDEFSKKLDSVSKDAEKKVQDLLTSEEMQKLKEYMGKIDEDAIEETKEQLVAQLTTLLELTEEQVVNLKPILEDGVTELEEMLNTLAKDGSASLEEFKKEYKALSKELHERLEEQLNSQQLDKLEEYNEERKVKIQQALFVES